MPLALRKLNRWGNTLKALLLMFAVIVYILIIYFVLYETIGIVASIILYLFLLFVTAYLIGTWVNKKFGKDW